MRDDLTFAERMHRDLREVRWPDPAEIGARARRRTRRTTALAAAAVLVVVALPAVVALRPAADPAPDPPAAPAAPVVPKPGRAEIPLDALLQQSDLAEKTAVPFSQAGLGEPVKVDMLLEACFAEQGPPTDLEVSRYSRSQTVVRERASVDLRPEDLTVTQDLYRLSPELAGRFFAGLDRRITACSPWRTVGPTRWEGRTITAEGTHRWEAAARNYTGDEAVLVRHVPAQPREKATGKLLGGVPKPGSTLVVRVGDLVTVLNPGRRMTETELLRLGRLAATRMCTAANPPC